MCDGLYDPWGAFPELQPNECSSVFPNLADLRAVVPRDGDTREVPTLLLCPKHDQCITGAKEMKSGCLNAQVRESSKGRMLEFR